MFHEIRQYVIVLRYEVLQYQRVHNFSPYPNTERDTLHHDMFNNLKQPPQMKCGIITKVLTGCLVEMIILIPQGQLKSNVEILYNNDKLDSDQIQELFGLNNLTQYEVQTNRKLLQKLDHNIKTLETKLSDLQKDVQILISDQNFFITLFQLRSRINVMQSSLRELEQNLNVAYKHFIEFTSLAS